jgi:hypothetical protein
MESEASQSKMIVISASAVVLLLVVFVVFKQYKKDDKDKDDIKENYNIYVANQARQRKCAIM